MMLYEIIVTWKMQLGNTCLLGWLKRSLERTHLSSVIHLAHQRDRLPLPPCFKENEVVHFYCSEFCLFAPNHSQHLPIVAWSQRGLTTCWVILVLEERSNTSTLCPTENYKLSFFPLCCTGGVDVLGPGASFQPTQSVRFCSQVHNVLNLSFTLWTFLVVFCR